MYIEYIPKEQGNSKFNQILTDWVLVFFGFLVNEVS